MNCLNRSKTIIFVFLLARHSAFAQLDTDAAKALLQRVIPARASQFQIEPIKDIDNKDVFEIESRNKKIVLRGNNGVAVASALYYYLNEFCHAQITWNGTNLNMPQALPLPATKIRKQTPYRYRYYLNYCTFNYTMSWWDWKRWEREIDWMALHGINMPWP
jgi:alpha-N-acetylglucosaminidase